MLYILAIMEQEDGKEGDIYVNGDLNNKFQPYFREKVWDWKIIKHNYFLN